MLVFDPRASGPKSLRLTAMTGWDEFPQYAGEAVALLGGTITLRSDSGDERLWTFERKAAQYRVSFEDLSGEVSMEPGDAAAGATMEEIRATLLAARK